MDALIKVASETEMSKEAMSTLAKLLLGLGAVGAVATPYSPLKISINKRYDRRPVSAIKEDFSREFKQASVLEFESELEKLAFMKGFRDTMTRFGRKFKKGVNKAKKAKVKKVVPDEEVQKKTWQLGRGTALAGGVALGASPFILERMTRVEKAASLLMQSIDDQMEKEAMPAWISRLLGRGGKEAVKKQFLGKGGRWLLGGTLIGAPLAYMGHQKAVRDAYQEGQYAGSAQIAALMQAMQSPQGGLNYNNRIGRM